MYPQVSDLIPIYPQVSDLIPIYPQVSDQISLLHNAPSLRNSSTDHVQQFRVFSSELAPEARALHQRCMAYPTEYQRVC